MPAPYPESPGPCSASSLNPDHPVPESAQAALRGHKELPVGLCGALREGMDLGSGPQGWTQIPLKGLCVSGLGP